MYAMCAPVSLLPVPVPKCQIQAICMLIRCSISQKIVSPGGPWIKWKQFVIAFLIASFCPSFNWMSHPHRVYAILSILNTRRAFLAEGPIYIYAIVVPWLSGVHNNYVCY